MTVRTDLSFNMQLSPRLIEVASPSVSITVQDLHDTLVNFEDSLEGGQYPNLVKSVGKSIIGVSIFTGVTLTLQNAQILFESRLIPISVGSSTSSGSANVLTDVGATFQSDGATRGAIIYNKIGDSLAEVLSVDSDTQITHRALSAGVWTSGDTYDIFNVIQCEISEGNLVSVDEFQSSIGSVFTTANTQIVRTLSVSAALIDGSFIPGQVWSELLVNNNIAGSFGNFVQKKLLTVSKFLGLS